MLCLIYIFLAIGRLDDTDDTLHTVKEKCREDDADADSVNSELYECYYCDRLTPTTDKREYEKYGINSHPRKRLYPFLSELENLRIKPKGKGWEI